MKIPFAPPRIDDKTIKEVNKALLSGWITTGPRTELFENRLAEYLNLDNVVCLNSATAGLQLAMFWLNILPGDEVIVPAYTYCATANVVLQRGAIPVMVDINKDDFNINTEAVSESINSKTKAIIAVDIAGYPADYNALRKVIEHPDNLHKFKANGDVQKKLGRVALISDAAHSIGASYNNQKTGNLADLSSFSFHAVKNLTTAEGGAVAFNLPKPFNNQEIKKLFKTLSLHGQSKDALSKNKAGGWEYDVKYAGFKCNMTDIQAAIGLVELDRYEETLNRRKRIFELYDQYFNKKKWANIPTYSSNEKTSSYHLYMLRINNCNEKQRNQIIDRISKEEIAVNVHYKPLPMLSVYKALNYKISEYPQAFQNYQCEISLPVYFNLSDKDVEIVANTVIKAVEDKLK